MKYTEYCKEKTDPVQHTSKNSLKCICWQNI